MNSRGALATGRFRAEAVGRAFRAMISAAGSSLSAVDGQIVISPDRDRKQSVIVARTLGVVFFSIMGLISIVVFLSEDRPDAFDHILIVAAPFGMGAIGYFVGLHNDPTLID